MEKNKREKNRYIRELLIMAFVLALVGLTVSYAVVNATLDIAGISAVKVANWAVIFDSAEVVSKKGTADILQEPKIRGLNVHYEVRLDTPGDSVTIKAVVKNRGTMDAKLASHDIFGIPSQYEDYISYKVTGEDGNPLNDGTVLKGDLKSNDPQRFMTVYITITYENAIYDDNARYKVFDLGLALNFVQDCKKCNRYDGSIS